MSVFSDVSDSSVYRELGKAWNMQYDLSGRARTHVVEQTGPAGTWQLLCTGGRGTHEFRGDIQRTDNPCPACVKRSP